MNPSLTVALLSVFIEAVFTFFLAATLLLLSFANVGVLYGVPRQPRFSVADQAACDDVGHFSSSTISTRHRYVDDSSWPGYQIGVHAYITPLPMPGGRRQPAIRR